MVVAVIVGNGCDDRAVGGQGYGSEFWAFTLKAADKFCRKVLRICGRTAIATGQHLAAAGDAGQDGRHRSCNGFGESLRSLVFQVGAVNEVLFNALF